MRFFKNSVAATTLALASSNLLTGCTNPADRYPELLKDSVEINNEIKYLKQNLDKHSISDYQNYHLNPDVPDIDKLLIDYKKRDLAKAEQKMEYTRVTLSTVRKCMAKEEKMIGDEPASSFLKVIFGGLLVIGAVHSIIERIRR